MAAASPTPMGSNDPGIGMIRRTSQRQAVRRPPSRPQMSRSESQPIQSTTRTTTTAQAQAKNLESQHHAAHDSSDDEIPVPMKLSALTKALLNDGGADAKEQQAQRAPSPPRTRRRASNLATSTSSATEERRHLRSGSVQAQEPKSARPASPHRAQEVKENRESKESSPVRKRVVKLSGSPNRAKGFGQVPPGKRRSTSTQRHTRESLRSTRSSNQHESREQSTEEKPELGQQSQPDVNTPQAQGIRVVRIAAGSSANRSRLSSSGHSRLSGSQLEHDIGADPANAARDAVPSNHSSASRPASNGQKSSSSRVEDNQNLQGSMRVKRVGKIPGSFLSGPARRGRRRQSEEEAEGNVDVEGEGMAASHDADGTAPSMYQEAASSFFGNDHGFASGSPVAPGESSRAASHRRHASYADLQSSVRHSPKDDFVPEVHIPFKVPSQRPHMPSAHDQENEAPSALKRSKGPSIDMAAHNKVKDIPRRPASTDVGSIRSVVSPERKPLGSLAQNTPHRPAPPPPPKMSVLQAATTTAGAATTSQKQRRNVLRVNGKSYTRLDCLGRGGSAKVYRVTAENGSMFALKRVSLEHADEATVKGYRGEIDLLGKLTGVDRVINLFDYEMNDEKKVLTLLMEMGEADLNALLRSRQNPETAKFDPVFVRYYWKEMLECLQSVHQYDIVHSDLKPANFVLVKGRLKLIDFGIANAIQTDETVNVHRETQIGTPNYMSPESLMDFNAPRGVRVPGRPKLMKLGKPSDVWSLGCILYQMVYGVPPFGHIANQMARCQAIINWDHGIEFPSRAMGGVPVPPSLLKTLKRCLNREIELRPTCEELLRETDAFLYPCELHDKALPVDEELLGRIIQSVVSRCREQMPTEAEARSVWPGAYWQSVKKAADVSRMS